MNLGRGKNFTLYFLRSLPVHMGTIHWTISFILITFFFSSVKRIAFDYLSIFSTFIFFFVTHHFTETRTECELY